MDCFETQDYFMNTIVEQKIYCKNPIDVYKKVVNEINRLENLMSFFKEDSDISKLNEVAGKEKVNLSSEVIHVLSEAYKFSELSNGAFDITLAPVIDYWRHCGRLDRVPCESEIKELMEHVGYKSMHIDNATNTAYLEKQGSAVDLGGIGKGFAADICVELYKLMGVESAFINFGGNVKTLGKKPEGDDWAIGIQHPYKQRGVHFGVVLASDKSVVTSGPYERYFEVDSKRYHHILDNRTGWPSQSDMVSATVICENSMQADALSTAAFVMGLEDGIQLIKKSSAAEAILVTKDNEIYLTKGIQPSFYLTEQNWGFSCYAAD
ncbi:thiamine biosynthesis lipoprotein ApbE precursor [Ruminiclostridium hungatei]|uniref:FAD:protein FMN transferase n=1 Tax=Ruminiclostridium hungatei TaxID=48256 RepID=A0A1V4SL43_RUMHU|nr:FAD:protein FMN transferase [Ruminiclostridium hungatei]OPX43967.1 thiamine biosynthesis lipoprotein ApbE precursor [Ruminiclostridium hungatei]